MTDKRISLILGVVCAMLLVTLLCVLPGAAHDLPRPVPSEPSPLVIHTNNPEVIKQIAELHKLIARLQTEQAAIAHGEQPGAPGTLMVIDPQTGVPLQTDERQVVRVIGRDYQILTYYKNGKWINTPILYGAENIPPPVPLTMEISRGGQIQKLTFPAPRQRILDGEEQGR